MRAWRLLGLVGVLGGAVAAIHCGSDDGSTFPNGADTTACKTAYPGQCGASCTADTSCANGLYCNGSHVCTADCAPSVLCADGTTCSSRGTCGTTGGGFVPDDSGIGDGNGEGGVCASTDVQLTKTEPQVLFLLDQSSSMYLYKFPGESVDSNTSNNCANGCRWTVLKTALIGANDAAGGLIKKLQGQAQMAVALYSATDSNPNDDDNSHLPSSPAPDVVCPRFNGKSFANAFPNGLTFSDSNFQDISNLLRPASVDDDTPTGYAIQTLVGIDDAGAPNNPKGFAQTASNGAPKVLVLVTDGEAGNCVSAQYSDNATGTDQQTKGAAKTLAVVKQAYKQNVSTFVIDVGGASLASSFKEIANAGQGKDPDTGDASAIAPTSTDALATALENIVLSARSCVFTLNGTVAAGKDSTGTVKVNDAVVPYGTGWHLKDPSTLELLADACNTVKTDPNARVSATFPCGTISVVK